MEFAVDSDLEIRVNRGGRDPLVFLPQIDWAAFEEPNILDAY